MKLSTSLNFFTAIFLTRLLLFIEPLNKKRSFCPDNEVMNSSKVTKLGRYPAKKREYTQQNLKEFA